MSLTYYGGGVTQLLLSVVLLGKVAADDPEGEEILESL
jgi:hypothetical protein